jgi:Ser-tRNA(Ala) deacylase AlaX
MEAAYMQDAYTKDFDAEIKEIIDGRFIVLDRTFFYPNSGGQPNDTGEMTDGYDVFKVINVVKKEGKILHELDKIGIKGDKVHCTIDWDRRYAHMRMHTAMHIVCEVFNRDSGAMITGNQIGIEKSRIDLNLEIIDREKIDACVRHANGIIAKGFETRNFIVSREEADKNPRLTKLAMGLPPQIKDVRIVEIGDFDSQADGGTHVRNTSEIGKIELVSVDNKGKNNRRISFSLSKLQNYDCC